MDSLKAIPTWNCAGDSEAASVVYPAPAGAPARGGWARSLRGAASAIQLAQQYVNGDVQRLEQVETRVAVDLDDPLDAHYLRLQNARTRLEYKEFAQKLDILEGNHKWKYDEESDECNMRLIRGRLDRLKEAHRKGDIEEMVALIRSGLTRDLGGMCNARLYQHTWSGTKVLIEEYTEVVKYTIERIAQYCDVASSLEVEKILVEIKAARQSFGNTGLMLSGGGTLGMCHIGVVKCLLEEDLLPRVVCGSSAGSIVGSVLCTHKANEIHAQLEELCCGDLTVFQGFDEVQGPAGMAFNLARGRCAFNIHNLCRVMKRLLGNVTFREAYNYSGRILNIHVSSRDKFNLPRLLNFQTAPNVIVWSAVASSCALPGVFEPPGLRAKDPETGEIALWGHLDHKWIDGSIEGDLPARQMERLFNVNNFIVSQVNPHVQPFLDGNEDTPLHEVSAQGILQQSFVKKGLRFAQASCIYALDGLMDRGFDWSLVKMGHSILGQKYHGDITILPDISWVPWVKVLANPEQDFMFKATRAGERATWPKIDRVRNHVAIELSLNAAIKHIHSARIGPLALEQSRAKPALPSARSDHGLAMMWKRPNSSRSVARPIPARRATHRPTKSLYDPVDAASVLQAVHGGVAAADNNIVSSSDEARSGHTSNEARSGHTSPVTSYEDEDFADVNTSDETVRPATPREPPKHSQRIDLPAAPSPFLSQPASPSFSFKSSYFGPDSHAGPSSSHGGVASLSQSPTALSPQQSSTRLRRAINSLTHLQMTSGPHAERKRQRH